MDTFEHLNYLAYLEEQLAANNLGFGLVFPKAEGAFYFGEEVTFSEYVDKYRDQCRKEGFLNVH